MKWIPILMSGEMVRATLADRKTQTRRTRGLEVVNANPDDWHLLVINGLVAHFESVSGARVSCKCPYGDVGDMLYVREKFMLESWTREFGDSPPLPKDRPWKHEDLGEFGEQWLWPHYAATDPKPELVDEDSKREDGLLGWSPSIHMPRWASRLPLERTAHPRCERVQNISVADCQAEGIHYRAVATNQRRAFPIDFIKEYEELWDRLNRVRGYGWSVNPWVWPIPFRRIAK